jgi:hypothetical protein
MQVEDSNLKNFLEKEYQQCPELLKSEMEVE